MTKSQQQYIRETIRILCDNELTRFKRKLKYSPKKHAYTEQEKIWLRQVIECRKYVSKER